MQAIIKQVEDIVFDPAERKEILTFVENCEKKIHHGHPVVLYGPGANGKTTLVNLITDYVKDHIQYVNVYKYVHDTTAHILNIVEDPSMMSLRAIQHTPDITVQGRNLLIVTNHLWDYMSIINCNLSRIAPETVLVNIKDIQTETMCLIIQVLREIGLARLAEALMLWSFELDWDPIPDITADQVRLLHKVFATSCKSYSFMIGDEQFIKDESDEPENAADEADLDEEDNDV